MSGPQRWPMRGQYGDMINQSASRSLECLEGWTPGVSDCLVNTINDGWPGGCDHVTRCRWCEMRGAAGALSVVTGGKNKARLRHGRGQYDGQSRHWSLRAEIQLCGKLSIRPIVTFGGRCHISGPESQSSSIFSTGKHDSSLYFYMFWYLVPCKIM